MLYLLTFADIKAVGPEAWTPWKNSLLMELFLKTSHFFERGAGTGTLPKERGGDPASPEIASSGNCLGI